SVIRNLIYDHDTGNQKIVFSLQKTELIGSSAVPLDDTNDSFVYKEEQPIFVVPPWISIIPSILTVLLAIVLKQNILALFVGVWCGATFLQHYNPLAGLAYAIDTIIVRGVTDTD